MTISDSSESPRAFISYSWSSPTHQSWVKNLATRLREDGVDVILDIWDLKPGHDSHQFMETMVTDSQVKKVIMICDKHYVEKADGRVGGVGTESQIISPEIYKSGTQDKFAAVITDEDENGSANVPVFYKGRIFFDFRFAEKYEDSYDELLRWLVDKPQHIKPKLGSLPDAVRSGQASTVATTSKARRLEEAIRQGAPSAAGLMREYIEAMAIELKGLAPDKDASPFDDAVIASVESMRPYIRQFNEIISISTKYSFDGRVWEAVIKSIESIGILMFRSRDVNSWRDDQFDSYRIICHEIFICLVALCLDNERFDVCKLLLEKAYLIRDRDGGGGRSTSDYTVFSQYIKSLEIRKQRLSLNRVSLEADLLKEAYPSGSVPSFDSLAQADFLLYLRALTELTEGSWYPTSLVYIADRYSPFPIFSRSESLVYWESVRPLTGAKDLESFKSSVAELLSSRRLSRAFGYYDMPMQYLANVENLAILP